MATQLVITVKQVGVIATVLNTRGAVLLVQNVSTQLVNTVKQVMVIATVLSKRGAVLLVQDVVKPLVNTVKQVEVIATVLTTRDADAVRYFWYRMCLHSCSTPLNRWGITKL